MRDLSRDVNALSALASMPFLDRLEQAAVTGAPERTTHDAVTSLHRRGMVGSVRHATELIAPTRRFHVTAAGLRLLAEVEGVTVDDLVRFRPVSAHMRRILLDRLDAVGVVYRIASTMAAVGGPLRFRWYRAMPMDAAIALPDGRSIGIVRQGQTVDRTSFSARIWRLFEGVPSSALLVIVPDAVRLRRAGTLLARSPVPAFLAVERDAALSSEDDAVWRMPSVSSPIDLRYALSLVRRSGGLPVERPSRALAPTDLEAVRDLPVHLLATLLRPSEKRALDSLFDWPWITCEDLAGMLGFTRQRLSQIVCRLEGFELLSRVEERRPRRLALSNRALALLARRDRTAVGAAQKQWSVEPVETEVPFSWRNVSGAGSRSLLRNIEHTMAVHRFIASLASQARSRGVEIVQLDPPHRASRHFRRDGKLRSIQPDAFGILRQGRVTTPFFLEWERRAVRPGTMAARLAPYLRYYASRQPIEEHGAQPLVLIVFDDKLVAARFVGVARNALARARVRLPLWISDRETLDGLGPLGKTWRSPDVLEPTYAFTKLGLQVDSGQ
ncbi:MAG: replication-relaxation family protein [Chloroflexota bacterium]|nr:replication-relaxation family protein [Chloroflexota bacterium]